jgi:hypothetical protein
MASDWECPLCGQKDLKAQWNFCPNCDYVVRRDWGKSFMKLVRNVVILAALGGIGFGGQLGVRKGIAKYKDDCAKYSVQTAEMAKLLPEPWRRCFVLSREGGDSDKIFHALGVAFQENSKSVQVLTPDQADIVLGNVDFDDTGRILELVLPLVKQ